MRTRCLIALLLPAAAGCASTSMVSEAEPYAAAAVEDIEALDRYLVASGLNVVESYEGPEALHPAVERSVVYDFGPEGKCAVLAYHTAEGARQFGSRNRNENVRDLRSYSHSAFGASGGGASSRDPRVTLPTELLWGTPHGGVLSMPTFTFGRHVASCTEEGAVWRAFRSLEDYAQSRS